MAVPVWRSRASNAQTIATRRNLLLQTILSAKSVTYVAMHDLIQILQQHGGKMEPQQRQNLEQMVPRMREHHNEFEKLHELWAKFDDGEALEAIEKALSHVQVALSEAEDTARLVERGRMSYEDT